MSQNNGLISQEEVQRIANYSNDYESAVRDLPVLKECFEQIKSIQEKIKEIKFNDMTQNSVLDMCLRFAYHCDRVEGDILSFKESLNEKKEPELKENIQGMQEIINT